MKSIEDLDIQQKAHVVGQEIVRKGEEIKASLGNPEKNYLLSGKERDNMVKVFTRKGFPEVAKLIAALPEIGQFELKEWME